MKAQIIKEFGEPEVFQPLELPKPEVLPGHVLIRVAATSVNPIDCKLRKGLVAIAPSFPAVLHGDVAGVIEEVGSGVTTFTPGDEVYGFAGGIRGFGGALAEYMLADATLIAKKPSSLTLPEAAALPVVALTAWEALFQRANIHTGQKIIVHAATGGVGHIGVQLAKWAGATVFTTASSSEKLAIARDLGADDVINYREESVADYVNRLTDGKGFDVVFDTVGGENLDRSFEAASVSGTVVSIATRSTHDLSLLHAKGLTLQVVFRMIPLLHNVNRVQQGEILSKIAQLVDEGHVRPLVDPRTYSFTEVAAAHRFHESGKAIGKVVLINESF